MIRRSVQLAGILENPGLLGPTQDVALCSPDGSSEPATGHERGEPAVQVPLKAGRTRKIKRNPAIADASDFGTQGAIKRRPRA